MPADGYDEVRSNANMLLALTCARMGALDVHGGQPLLGERERRVRNTGYSSRHTAAFEEAITEIENFEAKAVATEKQREADCDREKREHFAAEEEAYEKKKDEALKDITRKYDDRKAEYERNFDAVRKYTERGLVLKGLKALLADMNAHFDDTLPVEDIDKYLEKEITETHKEAAKLPALTTKHAVADMAELQKEVWRALGMTRGFLSPGDGPAEHAAHVEGSIKRGAAFQARPWRT
jgi:hypothetical protein